MKRYIRAATQMSYQEFKNTYSYAIKQWPDVTSMFGSDKYRFTMDETHYEKQGSRWVEVSNSTEDVSFINYMNTIDAVPFFKNLGGTERVSKSYTAAGLVPVKIESISPDKTEKTVRKFTIRYE